MKKGDVISTTEYLRVEGTTRGGLKVVDLDTGVEFNIDKDLAAAYDKAEEFDTTLVVSMTELAHMLTSAGDKVFTVSYNKQPEPLEVANAILVMSAKDSKSKTKVARLMKGELRVLRGRLIGAEPTLGRSNVIDLDIPKVEGAYDTRRRLVDHRTIVSLVIGNVQYKVK